MSFTGSFFNLPCFVLQNLKKKESLELPLTAEILDIEVLKESSPKKNSERRLKLFFCEVIVYTLLEF